MKASANNRKTATISIDIGKNTSTWLGWTSAGQVLRQKLSLRTRDPEIGPDQGPATTEN